MRCKICNREFFPSKYRPQQQVCSQPECQRLRQIQNLRDWRQRNPDYFKVLDEEKAWQEKRKRYISLWKSTHKDYLKGYQQAKKTQRKEYMREYMRRYRMSRA